MIYVFAIQLVSKRTLQGLTERMKGSRVVWGGLLTVIGCATVILVLLKNKYLMAGMLTPDVEVPMKDVSRLMVGSGKYEYVLAFEFISLFLLACIIGGLFVARKEEK
jgi:NADH-quinone oxidoreductase subunit J